MIALKWTMSQVSENKYNVGQGIYLVGFPPRPDYVHQDGDGYPLGLGFVSQVPWKRQRGMGILRCLPT